MSFIPIYEPEIGLQEEENLVKCARSGWISSQGEFVEKFEQDFANWHGMTFGVATSNCTTGLHLALAGLEIGQGDEVICPDLTFIAPANMIKLTGASAVLVDIEEPSWAINPDLIESKITNRTKAIVVVHPFGHAADMDSIMIIAKKYNLAVIEDVAEAPGARYKGRLVGTFGDVAVFSFFANKIMTCGEGGMVLTRDPALAKRFRIARDHGMSREQRYRHEILGFNYRMTNMQAAVGVAQLEKLEGVLERRKTQETSYHRLFEKNPKINVRPKASWCDSVHWMTTITLRHQALRDPLINYMSEHQIDCRQMVFPVHAADHFAPENSESDFPVSESISRRSLHCPSSNTLTLGQIEKITDLVGQWLDVSDSD